MDRGKGGGGGTRVQGEKRGKEETAMRCRGYGDNDQVIDYEGNKGEPSTRENWEPFDGEISTCRFMPA